MLPFTMVVALDVSSVLVAPSMAAFMLALTDTLLPVMSMALWHRGHYQSPKERASDGLELPAGEFR